MTTVKRPFEVTILAWITLLVAIVKLFTHAVVILSPEVRENLAFIGIPESAQAILQLPLSIHYLVSGIGTAVLLATGTGLLRAQHWGRITLALWSGWILLFAFLTTGSLAYVTPKLLVFVIMMAILFSPRAKAYFRAGQD